YESELLEKYSELENKIKNEKNKIEDLKIISNELETILRDKKKQILFQDFVKYEGRKEFIKELQAAINEKKELQDVKNERIKELNKEMKQYEDKKRIDDIKNEFFIKMKQSLSVLDVRMKEEYYKDPVSNKLE